MTKFYINVLRLLAFVLAGLALIRPMMDLAALSSVINLPKDDYAAVQDANKSWAWLEFIRLASFFSIIGLFFFEREHNRVIWPIRCAFIAQWCIVIIYVAFTLPINITTFNWTFFPDSNWAWLRIEWEYAGALSTIIGGISFVLLLLDLVWAKWRRS
jgi:preprotein translocase subunit SecE